ncbi:DUF7115 domain-containing protein [Halobaculum gomorrense]|uniref:DUF7115 domain-containing protein n=1 Tax=Halobaculum gomorrense TaxID=43928 RepID=A0A1M5MVF4_9EURY|nr:hypothetical protein [Halobaculum gomorrense]SHG81306.1 hypothetical protein SAMN05443636_1165 [Halobaculum gomorrense]
MSLPELVQVELGEEDPVARVHLGGDDELFVTPTRTLIYRAEGFLSDESVEEFPHDAERVAVSGGRKATFTLEYGLDGDRTFKIPGGKLDEVLHPVLAGVLSAAGITAPGETVERTFRFSELTLVVTSARLVKHVGAAVWDDDYEEFHYDDVTDLTFEEGSVATTLVLTADGRQERFKTPSDSARAIKERLTNALLAHYEVDTLEAFRALSAGADGEDGPEEGVDRTDFGGGPDPLSADPASVDTAAGTREDPLDDDALDNGDAGEGAVATGGVAGPDGTDASGAAGGGATAATEVRRDAEAAEPAESDARMHGDEEDGFGDSGFEPAEPTDDLAQEVAALRETVERQGERIERQTQIVEKLIEELRRGR